MERKMRLSSRWVLGLVAVLLVFGPGGQALAQTDVTSSRISGTIYDEHGGVLPGVVVEARNQDTGLNMRAMTDTRGAYRLVNLPTGTYTITATLAGFATAKHADVRLVLGSTPSVDFTMRLAAQAESITVTAAVPLVEVTNTAAATTMQTEQIKSLPLNGRDFKSLVLLTPDTLTERERGNIAISGQRGINTNVTVDGVDYNNAFFGGTTGTAEGRAPLSISQESIKEFSVITNGASVEFGRSAGGFVNVITKSGTNNLKGSLFYYGQPKGWISKRADGTEPADQEKKQYGLSFGGPLIKDKLFFFGSWDQQKQTVNIPVNAAVLDPRVATKYPALASAPQYNRTQDGQVLFGRIDYQISGSHRVTARANYTDYNGDHGTSGSQSYSSGHNGIEGMISRSYVGSYSGILGDNLLNDLNGQWISEDTPRLEISPSLPEIQVRTGPTYGSVAFLPIVSTAQRKNVGDTVTYLFKDHVFKAGFEYNDTKIDQVFKGNWRGVYVFNTADDLLAGKWSQYRQFGGLGGLTADQAGRAAFGQKETAAFLQDQWFANRNLTVSLGVRWERLQNPSAPVLNPNDKNADGSFNLTGKIPDEPNQFSPRLGITWSPGDGKTVLKLSVGRFWSRTPAILFAQLFTSNGRRGTQYIINAGKTGPTDPLSPGWGGKFDPITLGPIDFSKVPNPTGLGVFTIDPNFHNPKTDRLTLGFEREIFKDTAVSLDFTYAKTTQLERLSDVNLQYDIDPATGKPKVSPINGQPIFSKKRPNSFYGRIAQYTSDAESKYYGISAVLHRRFTERLFGFASVTWSQDFDNDSNERNYAGVQLEDVYRPMDDWGYSVRDQRWKIALNGVWNTPWWGISFSGLYRYSTGQPFSATTKTDANLDGNFTDRPTIGGVHQRRDSFRYPDFSTLDLRLQKAFEAGPGKIALILECFNCTNNANKSISNTVWGDGQTADPAFGKANTVTVFPRTYQFAVRYDF